MFPISAAKAMQQPYDVNFPCQSGCGNNSRIGADAPVAPFIGIAMPEAATIVARLVTTPVYLQRSAGNPDLFRLHAVHLNFDAAIGLQAGD